MYRIWILLILLIQNTLGATKNLPIHLDIWPPQVVIWNIANNKKLIYVAVHYTDDIKSATHQVIKGIFQNEKPDIYIMEGWYLNHTPERLKEISINLCEKQEKCYQSNYACYLATRNNVKFMGAWVSDKDQISLLKEQGYSREDVIFFLLARQLPYFFREGDTHNNQAFTAATWESVCNNYLQKRIAERLGDKVTLTYQDFLKWWNDRFKEPLDMERDFSLWERGVTYCHSNKSENALFTQKIANCFHKNTNNYMLKLIREAVATNQITLVVFGSGHLRDQWEKLIEAFGEPSSKENIEGAYIWRGG